MDVPLAAVVVAFGDQVILFGRKIDPKPFHLQSIHQRADQLRVHIRPGKRHHESHKNGLLQAPVGKVLAGVDDGAVLLLVGKRIAKQLH